MGPGATMSTCSGANTTGHGTMSLNPTTGCFTYIPAPNYVGKDTACIIVCNNGVCDTTLITIDVTPKKDTVPIVTPFGTPHTLCVPQITDMGAGATIKTCSGSTTTSHGSMNLSNYPDCITYTPALGYVGNDTACVIVCNNGVCDTTLITIIVLPRPDTAIVTREDSAYNICVPTIPYMGTGTTIKTCSGSSTTSHGTIDVSKYPSCITYKPDSNYVGFDKACIIVCNNGTCDTVNIDITVLPKTDTHPKVTPEDTPLKICVPEITDMGSLPIVMKTCSGSTATSHGTTIVDPATGCITYTPALNYVGKDTACVIICNNGVCDTTIIPINVLPKKDTLPIVTPEDQAITICKPAIADMGPGATMTTCSGANTTSHGTMSLNPTTGCFTYIPAPNYVGKDTACIIVCNNGVCDTTLITIDVTPKKDTVPIVTPFGTPHTLCVPQITDMGAGATIKTCSGSTTTSHGSMNLSNYPDCITYTPALGYVGNDTACVIVCNNGVCDTTLITIIVLPRPDTAIVTREDSAYNICVPTIPYMGTGTTIKTCSGSSTTSHGTIDVSKYPSCITYKPDSNYVGFDKACIIVCNNGTCDTVNIDITVLPKTDTHPKVTPEDTPLKICVPEITDMGSLPIVMKTCSGSTATSHGTTIVDPATGCITYTPALNYVGKDTACVIICNNGVCDTTIIPINVLPKKDTLPIVTPEDQAITICKPAIADMGPGATMSTCSGLSTTSHGTISLDPVSGCFTYTPSLNYVGRDTGCIIVCKNGVCDTTIITINVTPKKDTLPIITPQDTSKTICIPQITNMGNTNVTIKTCSGSLTTLHGTLNLSNYPSCITYVPAPNYVGKDTGCIIVCNGTICDTTIILIDVTPNTIIPKLDLRKSVDTIIAQSDGNYMVRFKIKAFNPMTIAVDSVKIQDDLNSVFPSVNDYMVSSVSASGTLIANNLYNGSGVIDLVNPASKLGAGKSDSVYLNVIVKPSAAGKQLNNIAIIQGKTPFGNPVQSSDDPTINPADTSGTVNRDATPFILPASDIIIPGGFSPNRDGIDDVYIITVPPGSKVALKIFNRWQHRIYESNDYKNDWDGRGPGNVLGDYVPMGTYYYLVSVTLTTGEVRKLAGPLTLVR